MRRSVKQLTIASFLAGVLLASCAAAATDIPPRPSAGCSAATIETGGPLQRTVDVDGVSRAYLLDVPASVTPKKPVPLLFDFHGFGHSAAGVWKVSKFHELAARDGFITVYPDGLPVTLRGQQAAGWDIFTNEHNRDVAFTARVLDHLEHAYCIDLARIFVTGFSNGAFFSHLLGCRMADRIAAIAPVSGGRIPPPCDPGRGVPVLIHHGRQDPRIDVADARAARDAWIEKNGCREHVSDDCEWHRQCRDGADVGYCEDDGVHYWPVAATERIWKFFQAHPLAPAALGKGLQ